MAPCKRITDGVTFRDKAKATAGGMTSKPTNNQCVEGTDSISPQEPSASVQSSQPQEDQFFQMLYEMKEQMKEQQQQSNREWEQMALERENILRK